MFLWEIAIYADEEIVDRFKGGFVHAFHTETCCVAASVGFHLRRKLRSKDVTAVKFKFSDLVQGPPEELAIHNIRWPFDFSRYCSLDNDSQKKKQIAEALLAGMLWVAPQVGWEMDVIQRAFENARQNDFALEGFCKPSWLSPSGKFRMRVFARLDLRTVELYAVLSKNRSKVELARRLIASLRPYDDAVDDYVREAGWSSETAFTLTPAAFHARTTTIQFGDVMTD